jgi:hypothetical protein
VNLSRIGAERANATTLRNRVLCQLNGEARLSADDQKRRERIMESLRDARRGGGE